MTHDDNADIYLERKIITGLIVCDEYLGRIAPVYAPDCLGCQTTQMLAQWCLDYFREFHRAPRRDIEGIFTQHLKNDLNKEVAEGIEEILHDLSREYESQNGFHSEFLIKQTIAHFQNNQAKALHYQQSVALKNNDTDEFYKLHQSFKPVVLNSADQYTKAGELYDTEIQTPKWLILDLIPVGLTILGGRSKVGKSYFMMNLAMALAQGKPFAEQFRGQRGPILYLSLEDGRKRFQERMRQIDPHPDRDLLNKNLTVCFQWEQLNRGGLPAITDWVGRASNPKLIVIDTLAKVWSKKSGTNGAGLYAEEYALYSPLADLAHKHELSMVVVTHTTKGQTADVFDQILGGMGTQGPADNLIVLANDKDGRKRLSIRGKDIEERHLAFETKDGPGRWACLGEAAEMQMTAERQEIVDLLNEQDRPMTLQEIREELKARGSAIATPHILLRKMVRDDILVQPEQRGPYQIAGYSTKKVDASIGQAIRRKYAKNNE
jgi:hypothetical protein